MRAKAAADAALLMSPQLVAQGLRSPQVSVVDPTLTGSPGVYQLRVGLSFSPVDLYKGLGVGAAADADCERHDAQRNIEALLEQVHDLGKLPGLRKQIEFLESQRETWERLQKTATERLSVRAITLMDENELRKRVLSLERRVSEQQGEAERILARSYPDAAEALSSLARTYARRSYAYEKKLTAVRSLSAWNFRLSGGVIPAQSRPLGAPPPKVDWYGFSELSFNFGGLSNADDRYLQARQAEVSQAPYELVSLLGRFQRETRARLSQGRRELESLDRQLASTSKARQMLEQSEAPNSAQAVSLLKLDEMWIEAERRYLQALTEALSTFLQQVPNPAVSDKS